MTKLFWTLREDGGIMTYSGSSLLSLSQQFGQASTLLAVNGSLEGIANLSENFRAMRDAGVMTPAQYEAFHVLLLQGAVPHFPAREDADLASTVEAQILGRLVRSGALPDEARERFRDMVSGRCEVTAGGILEAHRRVRAPWIVSFLREAGIQPVGTPHHVRRTRLERFAPLEEDIGRPVYLKREDEQHVGSFKIRGATNLLVAALLAGYDPKTLWVGTASHGNHAQGVVQAAHNLGIRNVEVLLPKNASPLKIAQLKLLGAQVELFGDTFEECADEVEKRARINANYLFVPAFDQPLVVMGQGTTAVELSLQMAVRGETDYSVLVPAGGGGLLAGMATYLANQRQRRVEGEAPAALPMEGATRVPVIGIESKAHPYISRSFDLKRIAAPEEIRHYDTVADGIALLKIGAAGFRQIVNHVRAVRAVSETFIEAALAYLKENSLTLEGAAAAPIAALLFGGLSLESCGIPGGSPVVVMATGRNIDTVLLAQMGDKHGGGGWRQLKDEMRALREKLAQAGYLQGDAVRELKTAEDAVAFVDFLAAHLPEGWDLIDALDRLDFGPWGEKKNLNGTLRSLGQYQQRWNHSKEEALTHPESDRGQKLEFALRSLSDGAALEEVLKNFPVMYALRLKVETHVMDFYLDRPDWLARLRPQMSEEARRVHFAQFRGRNDRLKAAVERFLKHLENGGKTHA